MARGARLHLSRRRGHTQTRLGDGSGSLHHARGRNMLATRTRPQLPAGLETVHPLLSRRLVRVFVDRAPFGSWNSRRRQLRRGGASHRLGCGAEVSRRPRCAGGRGRSGRRRRGSSQHVPYDSDCEARPQQILPRDAEECVGVRSLLSLRRECHRIVQLSVFLPVFDLPHQFLHRLVHLCNAVHHGTRDEHFCDRVCSDAFYISSSGRWPDDLSHSANLSKPDHQ
mmetsp:Transcript_22705/g.52044  ORF Transcript_22705/g.52044 Transcript_22705/m.52044 type:complete len:225 (-) Transcript_22705:461-1135(-)